MLKDFLELLKNKKFLILLLVVNTIIFILGFVINHIDLMLLSVASYATVLLSIELNKDSSYEEDD